MRSIRRPKFNKSSGSEGDDGAEILVLDDGVFAEDFYLVHLDHALSGDGNTPVTFSQEAAPVMLASTGEDSVKGTPFLASMMNLMQLMYMYSL